MNQTPEQSKPQIYDEDWFLWYKRLYLKTIKACYEEKDYINLNRVHQNYLIIWAKFRSKDPLYRDKPIVQRLSKERFLDQPSWEILGRKLLNGGFTKKPDHILQPVPQTNTEQPTIDDRRAAEWFQKNKKADPIREPIMPRIVGKDRNQQVQPSKINLDDIPIIEEDGFGGYNIP